MTTMTAFRIVERQAQPAAVVRGAIPMDELPDFFGRAFGTVMEVLQAQGVTPVGAPFGFYLSPPGEVVDLFAGFPISAPFQPSGEVEAMELPAGRAVTGIHVGPYDTLEATYGELIAWMAHEGLVPAKAMWESYLSDPSEEPPERWRTEIVWPIEE